MPVQKRFTRKTTHRTSERGLQSPGLATTLVRSAPIAPLPVAIRTIGRLCTRGGCKAEGQRQFDKTFQNALKPTSSAWRKFLCIHPLHLVDKSLCSTTLWVQQCGLSHKPAGQPSLHSHCDSHNAKEAFNGFHIKFHCDMAWRMIICETPWNLGRSCKLALEQILRLVMDAHKRYLGDSFFSLSIEGIMSQSYSVVKSFTNHQAPFSKVLHSLHWDAVKWYVMFHAPVQDGFAHFLKMGSCSSLIIGSTAKFILLTMHQKNNTTFWSVVASPGNNALNYC